MRKLAEAVEAEREGRGLRPRQTRSNVLPVQYDFEDMDEDDETSDGDDDEDDEDQYNEWRPSESSGPPPEIRRR